MRVVYHPDVGKEVAGINRKILARIRRAIETRIMVAPLSYGEPLRFSLKGHRKLRVGDYRVVYRMSDDDEIVILGIGHRKEVYSEIVKRLQL